MAIFYLDTSAILKRYRTENGTDFVSELYEQLGAHDLLLTSHFACLEFECVAARALKAKLLTPAAYNMLLGGLARDIGEYLLLMPVASELVNDAIEVTRRFELRAPDAIHVAAAQQGDRTVQGGQFVFVTSDKELLAASNMAGMTTLDPESEHALDSLRELRRRGGNNG